MLNEIIARHIRADMRRIEQAAENGALSNWMRDLYHRLNVALGVVESVRG